MAQACTLLSAFKGAIAMAVLERAGDGAQGPEGEPRCGCADCSARATWRLALTIGRSRAGLVPLCSGHAEDVRNRRWAMQVEEDWGGALRDGQHEALGDRLRR